MRSLHLYLFVFLSFSVTYGQAPDSLSGGWVSHQILPSQTDLAIDGNNFSHYTYWPDGALKRHQLLVFFPGTNARPQDYRLFMQTAAQMGYHVVGLCYENLESINLDVCPGTQDTTCHGRARAEVWFGEDLHDSLHITPANSVINRLSKLLQYLKNQYPDENWDQFIHSDDTPVWSKITTAGHSQGAGHACFAAKQFPVSRAIMFSWVDWMWPGRPSAWVKAPGATPDSAFAGFIHTGDASIFYGIPATWETLGMLNYGPLVNIDTTIPPYGYSHSLITTSPIDTTPTQTNFHNATCVDWTTPLVPSTGQPLFLPVWQYLLGEAPASPGDEAIRISPAGVSYIDPEFLPGGHVMGYQTGTGEVWLANMNPVTGRFQHPEGKDILLAQGATPLVQSFNGPEFGMDTTGWSVFFTKNKQVWRAVVNGNVVTNTQLTFGNVPRLSTLASKSPQSESIRLLYGLGTNLYTGQIAWTDEDSPFQETIVDSIDTGVRWVTGTRNFIYIKQTGPDTGQLVWYDSETDEETVITDDSAVKSFPYGWFAPEYQSFVCLSVIGDTALAIYQPSGNQYWDRIATLEMPASSAFSYFGSPEPFVSGGRSYISFVSRQQVTASSYVPAEVWVMGIDPDPYTRFTKRCDDGAAGVIRTDPESYLGSHEVFIYYNLVNSEGQFEIWRYASGIGTTVAIEGPAEAQPLILYPNPGSSAIFVKNLPPHFKGRVCITTNEGKIVMDEWFTGAIQINLLPAGHYFIQLSGEQGEVFRGRFVKQ